MKKIFFFLSLSFLMFACENDDPLTADLIHDRGINDAPFILAGEYIVATRFTASEMSEYQGKKLEGIEYYLKNKPTQSEIRVYEGSNGDEPETLVYSETTTVDDDADSWNLHTPSSDIELSGQDLWLAYRIVLNAEDATIGCDVGTAVPNGDWILDPTDNQWKTYRTFTNNNVSINWNIRGYVED